MKKNLIILIVVIVLAIIVGTIYYNSDSMTGCTEEAKICPDGTAVERTGSNCEFEKCSTSKNCEKNEDCIVFGETGDCNCGCYNIQSQPTSTGGDCFCAAPINCECIDKKCEGIFE